MHRLQQQYLKIYQVRRKQALRQIQVNASKETTRCSVIRSTSSKSFPSSKTNQWPDSCSTNAKSSKKSARRTTSFVASVAKSRGGSSGRKSTSSSFTTTPIVRIFKYTEQLHRANVKELFLKEKIRMWKLLKIEELKHLLKSFIISYKNFLRSTGFHGNINQNSITLSKLPNLEPELEKQDSPFCYGYRLNYLHWDVMTPYRWTRHKIDRLLKGQRWV